MPMNPDQFTVRSEISAPTAALLRELLARSALRIGVPDIMIWLADPEGIGLEAMLGVGPQSALFERRYVQTLGEGLISLVHQNGQALCRNHVEADPSHSDQLDVLLGQHTHAMVVAPVRLGDKVAGVVSCAAVSPVGGPSSPQSFETDDLREIEFLAACVGRILHSEFHDAGTR